jgi:REP element-mobilizing transposase RayT
MRDRWKFYESKYPYFMTCTVVGWLPVFTRTTAVRVIADSWKYLQEKRGVVIFGYVILENHLHWIARMPDPATDAGDFKSFTARKIIDLLLEMGEAGLLSQLEFHKDCRRTDRQYQLWQEGSHPEILQTEEVLRQKLEYTHNNPVTRGYVADPTHWLYSSARNYAKLSALIDIETRW